jgi:hypothetical protein
MLDESMLTIMLCGSLHGKAHTHGRLSAYSNKINEAWNEQMAGLDTSREFGAKSVESTGTGNEAAKVRIHTHEPRHSRGVGSAFYRQRSDAA